MSFPVSTFPHTESTVYYVFDHGGVGLDSQGIFPVDSAYTEINREEFEDLWQRREDNMQEYRRQSIRKTMAALEGDKRV